MAERRQMVRYFERIDELITEYGGHGQLTAKANGVYEFRFDKSKKDITAWNGEDFIGVQTERSLIYIPLTLLIVSEKH